MAAIPPKGCPICRTIKKKISNINYNMRKHVMIYAFFYLLLFEGVSLLLVREDNYTEFWYPLLTQLALTVIFYNLYLFRIRLKFCLRKKIAVASLSIYYFIGALSLICQFCYSWYLQAVNHLLLLVAFVTIVLTIYKEKK